MSKNKTYTYRPKESKDEKADISGYSAAQVEKARAEVEKEQDKKQSKVAKVSAIWTIISTIYAIITTCVFIANDWVNDTFSIVLLVILIVYIIAFVFLVALTVKDPKKAKLPIKYYKKGLKIFKAFANVVFLVLSAVSMAGIAGGGMGIKEWIVFIATFMVAVVQLAIKVSLLVLNIVRRNLTSKYKVKVKRYVNGEEKKKKAVDVIEEKF